MSDFKNGWESKRSLMTSTRDPKTNEIVGYHGIYNFNGLNMSFTMSSGGDPKYAFRGSLTILDPNTNKSLKYTTDSGQEKACSSAFYINQKPGQITKKAIKEKIAETALKLYSSYYQVIRKVTLNPASYITLTPLLLLKVHATGWLTHRAALKGPVSERRNATDLSILEHLYSILDQYDITELTPAIIESARNQLGNKSKKAELLASEFWDYCLENEILPLGTENPFDLVRPHPRRNANHFVAKPPPIVALPDDVERALKEAITNKYRDDPLYIAASLVVDAGRTAQEISKHTWSDIIWGEDGDPMVCLRIIKNKTSGSTIDYTRPIFPFTAEILRNYYQILIDSGLSEQELSRLPILIYPTKDKRKARPAITHNDITKKCRTLLTELRLNYANLHSAYMQDSRLGAGVTILLNTYAYKLATICGLQSLDPAALCYMKSNSLSWSVTADCYRSFSSPEGLHLLYRYLLRDTRFLPERTEPNIITRLSPEGMFQTEVFPEGKDYPASCTVSVTLAPGEIITIYSTSGLRGTYLVTKANE